jgi:urease accessory protein
VTETDTRPAADVGRRARLVLVFERRGARTVLSHGYAEPPLRVGRPLEEASGLHVILASSAPGIFGGDRFDLEVHLGCGARVRLSSQSALQVHPSPDGETATLTSRYRVDAGGELSCSFDPLIPFAGARLEQRVELDVASGARLYWSDGLMSGRQARGERWAFTAVSHELALRREGRLEYLERYRIDPAERSPARPWIAAGSDYAGTILMLGSRIPSAEIEALQRDLEARPGLSAAIDLVDDDLAIGRLLSSDGAAFHDARRAWSRWNSAVAAML